MWTSDNRSARHSAASDCVSVMHSLALLGWSRNVKAMSERQPIGSYIIYLSCGLFVFLIVVFIYSLTGKLEPNWFENRLFSANVTMPSGTFSWHLHSADYTISMFEFYFRQGPSPARG